MKLLVLADRWQMLAVAAALQAQLEAALSPCDATWFGLLASTYPDSVSSLAEVSRPFRPFSVLPF